MFSCAECGKHACRSGLLEQKPKNCPMQFEEEYEEIAGMYLDPEINNIALNSGRLESSGYGRNTRLEEIMEFARMSGFRKLGLAFCMGFVKEARVLNRILKTAGFEVASVVCKNGAIPKEHLGMTEEEKLRSETFEPICNPIGQAWFLNKEGTDLNIILGLCVGHDSLFIKYSQAPITCFVVKDRVLGHNPIAALYLSEGYFKKRTLKLAASVAQSLKK